MRMKFCSQADAVERGLQQENARPGQEHENQQSKGHPHVQIAQALDALAQSQPDAGGKQNHRNGYNSQFKPEIGLPTHDSPHQGRDHRRGKAQRQSRASKQADHEKPVDQALAARLFLATKEIVATGAQSEKRSLLDVIGVGNRQRGQTIKTPGGWAPVKKAIGRSPLGGGHRATLYWKAANLLRELSARGDSLADYV
jgi:hypothetical protein